MQIDDLRALLRYDPGTGAIHWRNNRKGSRGIKAGDIAGTPHGNGYISVRVSGKAYLAHRLAWLLVHGVWPVGKLDHRDHDKCNNRMGNLREATDSLNGQNRRAANKDSATGLLGVTRSTQGGFQAQIGLNRKNRFIGRFDSAEAAHAAYVAEKRRLHEGCTI